MYLQERIQPIANSFPSPPPPSILPLEFLKSLRICINTLEKVWSYYSGVAPKFPHQRSLLNKSDWTRVGRVSWSCIYRVLCKNIRKCQLSLSDHWKGDVENCGLWINLGLLHTLLPCNHAYSYNYIFFLFLIGCVSLKITIFWNSFSDEQLLEYTSIILFSKTKRWINKNNRLGL